MLDVKVIYDSQLSYLHQAKATKQSKNNRETGNAFQFCLQDLKATSIQTNIRPSPGNTRQFGLLYLIRAWRNIPYPEGSVSGAGVDSTSKV